MANTEPTEAEITEINKIINKLKINKQYKNNRIYGYNKQIEIFRVIHYLLVNKNKAEMKIYLDALSQWRIT